MRVHRVLLGVGIAALLVGLALLLWPLDAPGVSGSALRPHYREYGWSSTRPLPRHPTLRQLRDAGVPVPQDTVRRRRVASGAALAVAAVAAGGWWSARRRARLPRAGPGEDPATRRTG